MELFDLVLSYEISVMKKYLDFLSDYISTLPDKIDEEYQIKYDELIGDKDTIDNEAAEHYAGSKDDDLIEVCRDIPKYFYSSFLISCYSFIEQQLFIICKDLKIQVKLDIEECNSFGNGIEKVKIFLRKALSYEIPSTLWHELTNINKLRNCLVHNGPVIFPEFELPDENDQSCSKYMFDKLELKVDIKRDLMDYLMQNKLIQNWGIQLQIIPTKEYCNRVLIFAEELLEKTHHDLNKFVKSKG